MNNEHWPEVERALAAALELPDQERAAYLLGLSPTIRIEVESLLAAHGRAAGFLSTTIPVLKSDDDFAAGTQFAHYRIEALLGRGGMGTVYRALDLKLNRPVAIKVLSSQLADKSTRRRFQREAQMASALNHPHILTVHDAGEFEGRQYLVTEYVDGGTLRDWAKVKERDWREGVELLLGVADSLAVAHEARILHRDIKPANILVSKRGYAKLADFGLAKLAAHAVAADEDVCTATTETTLPGLIMGTFAYMSPEQASGGAVDARSDIFSFGIVLYEVIAGCRPFMGATELETLQAIRHSIPQPLSEDVPLLLQRLVLKVLDKDPAERYQTMRDLVVDLRHLVRRDDEQRVSHSRQHTSDSEHSAAAIHRFGTKYWRLTVAAGLLLVGLAAVFYFSMRAPALTEKDTIVLADFANTTGDPVFDGALRQGLAVQLEQSPFLSVVSDNQVQQTLRMMGRDTDVRLTSEIAREVCQRTTSTAVIYGSIVALGRQFVVGLKAVNCRTGDLLTEEQTTANAKEEVLRVLGLAASRLRRKLGESLNTVERFATPIEQATTPSLEALQAYSLGQKTLAAKADPAAAVPFFRRAISLDPNFAMAYALLGLYSAYLGQTSLGAENTRKAYQLRERVSQREKFFIEANYEFLVSGNLEKARQGYELWAQTYPRDALPSGSIATIYVALGHYDKALEKAREALKLDRGDAASYASLVGCFILWNQFGQAQATAEEAQARNLDSAWMRMNWYMLAFFQGDAAGMARQLAWSAGKPGVEDVLLALDANTAAYSGHLRMARELSGRAVASAERTGQNETAAAYEAEAALREALFGNAAKSRERATSAIALSMGRDVRYGAALALAFAADSMMLQTRVEKLAADLGKRYAEDTAVQFNYLPTIRAELALGRNEPSSALNALQLAAPYELGSLGWGPFLVVLYPAFVRGEAYLTAKQGPAAAVEFQKILDHRGAVVNEPIGALALLGLARAYALSGDTAKSGSKYEDFFALWKDADPDIPILKEAKKEYDKLR
ncbi:MAG: hypothetical protein C5B58_07475 [Acidobacteria bacterium]|nr:MAG: hypothetical protein C5B58_07475 [Acidobacteriota bacterium]